MPDRPLVPVIAGPTAGGKTALAMACARAAAGRDAPGGATAGEIVSADAFQVYRGMDIGTGKPTEAERDPARGGVTHHLVDTAEPTERFTVADWLARATGAIAAVEGRGGWPIVAGGTHLYIKALLDGLFEGPPADASLRAELAALEPAALRAELARVDPPAAERIHPADLRRTIRALEVHRLTGRPISDWATQWDTAGGPLGDRSLLVVLDWSAGAINPRINARVEAMFEGGLVEEVARLHAAGRLGPQAAEALGYKQVLAHLRGEISREKAFEATKIQTRRLAKNQRTWLRRLLAAPGPGGGVLRLRPESQGVGEMSQAIVRDCFRCC